MSSPPPGALRRWRMTAAPVVIVAAVAAAVRPDHVATFAGVAAALVFIIWVARHPHAAMNVLVLGVLFNLAALALLYRLGLPASVVKALSLWKLAVVIGLSVAIVRRGALRKPDALEVIAGVYVLLGSAYFVVPGLFVGNAIGAHLTTYERALGWRGDIFYILVFIVFRRLRLAPDVVDTMLHRFLGVAVVLALFGLFEAAAPSAFDRLATSVLGIPRYEHDIVGYQPSSAFSLHSVLVYSGPDHTGVLRIGSLLVDYLSVGFVFAIGLGIAADRLARDPRTARVWAALVVLLAATALTETRSAIIAAAIATIVALRRRAGKPLWARARLGRVLAVGLLALLPLAAGLGVLVRFVHAPQSNGVHQAAFRGGLTSLENAPFGNGLGAAEGGAQILLAGTGTSVVTEDQYLQIGAVLGFPGLIIYVSILGTTLVRLVRRSTDEASDLAPSAMSNAAIGCFIGALFTQAFTNLELSITFWALAGMAVGVVDQRTEQAEAIPPAGMPGVADPTTAPTSRAGVAR